MVSEAGANSDLELVRSAASSARGDDSSTMHASSDEPTAKSGDGTAFEFNLVKAKNADTCEASDSGKTSATGSSRRQILISKIKGEKEVINLRHIGRTSRHQRS